MSNNYDIFEKFPNGCSIWRACVLGQYEAQRKIQELAEHSENEFFVVDLLYQDPVPMRQTYRLNLDLLVEAHETRVT